MNLFAYANLNPVRMVDPRGLSSLQFDPTTNTISFYNDSTTVTYEARNDVTAGRTPINPDFHSNDVFPRTIAPSRSYGPGDNTYIDTEHPKGKDIHGGGNCSDVADPYADEQGWCPTWGCMRMQNEDIRALSNKILEYKNANPQKQVPFSVQPYNVGW